jgi:membrane-bound acyltransferase YfiQ involved in biofilm formation
MPTFYLNSLDPSGIVFFTIVLFALLLIYKSNVQFSNLSLGFTSENSNYAQGIFIGVVVIHHISRKFDASPLTPFDEYGYLAVGVFFLLSGYGLGKSFFAKGKCYLFHFIKKKVQFILIPFFLVNMVTSIFVFYFTDIKWDIFLKYFFSFNLIDGTSWFVVAIFLFYVFFYISFTLFKSKSVAIVFVFVLIFLYIFLCKKILGLSYWWYASSLCFPVGLVLGIYEINFNAFFTRFKMTWVLLSIAMLIVFFVLFNSHNSILLSNRSLTCLIFSVSTFACLSFIRFNSPIALFMARYSLEIYLVHMKVMLIFSYFFVNVSFIWLFGYFLLLMMCAYLFSVLHRKVGKIIF